MNICFSLKKGYLLCALLCGSSTRQGAIYCDGNSITLPCTVSEICRLLQLNENKTFRLDTAVFSNHRLIYLCNNELFVYQTCRKTLFFREGI